MAAVALLLVTVISAVTRLADDEQLDGIDAGVAGLIDPDDATITERYRIGTSAGAVVAGAGSVWVAAPREGTVARIRPQTDRVSTIDVGGSPIGLAYGAGALWVAVSDADAVVQVDPRTNRVVQPIRVGNGLRALAVDADTVWAATALDGDVVRISLDSGRVTGGRRLAASPPRWRSATARSGSQPSSRAARSISTPREPSSPASVWETARVRSPQASARSGWPTGRTARSRASIQRATP